MKQVNLLPLAVRQKAAKQQIIPLIIFAVLVGVGAVGMVWAAVNTERSAIQTQLATVQAADAARSAQEKKDHPDPTVDNDLVQRVTELNTLAKGEINWGRAMGYVGGLIPKDITLSNYNLSLLQTGPELKMSGQAPSSVSFATFAQALQSDKDITSFTVDGFVYNPANGSITFSVSIAVPLSQIDYSAP